MTDNAPDGISAIPQPLGEFVATVITSYLVWDVLTFLRLGIERAEISLEEIADSIGRDSEHIMPALKHLKKYGFLHVEERDGRIFCSLTKDEAKRSLIQAFEQFSETREGRLKIIYCITKYRMQH